MAKLTISPPDYHKAYAPTIVRVESSDRVSISGGEKTATLSIKNKENGSEAYTINVELLHKYDMNSSNNTYIAYAEVDIRAYVCSLFGHSDQAVSYTLALNGASQKTCMAIRSATQLGEKSDMKPMVRKLLTDMDKLRVYDGYPITVSYLSDDGDFIETITDDESTFFDAGSKGLNAVSVDCSMDSITIHKKRNYNTSYLDFICQKSDYIHYLVKLVTEDKEKGTVEEGGIVKAGDSIPIKAIPNDSNEFDAWFYNEDDDQRREDIPQDGNFTPTESCTLEARFTQLIRVTAKTENANQGLVGLTFDDINDSEVFKDIKSTDTVTFYAKAKEGYAIDHWEYADGSRAEDAVESIKVAPSTTDKDKNRVIAIWKKVLKTNFIRIIDTSAGNNLSYIVVADENVASTLTISVSYHYLDPETNEPIFGEGEVTILAGDKQATSGFNFPDTGFVDIKENGIIPASDTEFTYKKG